MSVKATGKVWELKLPPARQMVLLALADHADHDGRSIRPGVPLIAWKTGYSERQVQRIIKTLVASGLLKVTRQSAGKPTEYAIDFSKGVTKSPYIKRQSGDIALSPDKMSVVTSHEENFEQGGDTPSANLSRYVNKENRQEDARATLITRAVRLYETAFGAMPSALIAEQLQDYADLYTIEWVEDALKEAAINNAKSMAYVRAVLLNWRRDGRKPTEQPKPPARVGSYVNIIEPQYELTKDEDARMWGQHE